MHRNICEKGDSLTEPYLAGHNVLNSHARAVSLYRTRYKREQGGMIGMTLNCDWTAVRQLNIFSPAPAVLSPNLCNVRVCCWARRALAPNTLRFC